MIKVVTIVGARPQFIKAAAVSRAIAQHNKNAGKDTKIQEVIVHTGQHYDGNMSNIFFKELYIPEPDYNLGVGSGSHGQQTARILAGIEDILIKERPRWVLTYGDTNSTVAGALAAVKLNILSVHVEAGLRSYNRRMPEEINRLIADELANILFCPTDTAVENLKREGIVTNFSPEKEAMDVNRRLILNAGDVMYDSLLFNQELSRSKSVILQQLNLVASVRCSQKDPSTSISVKPYCLATVHRAENTDDIKRLHSIMDGLSQIAATGVNVILPVHPRTRKRISGTGLVDKKSDTVHFTEGIRLIDPVGYLDMVQLESHAKAIFTDSGGVQKEAFLLKTPCITLREETEWVETVKAGWNILAGSQTDRIIGAFSALSSWDGIKPPFENMRLCESGEGIMEPVPENVYGNGEASKVIVESISSIIC